MSAFLVAGLLTGLLYGLLGLGVVLIYTSARFVNLAQAQVGVLAALILAKLVIDGGWSYWAAWPVAVLSGAAVGVASEFLVIRRLRSPGQVPPLLLTLGLAQVLLAFSYFAPLKPNPAVLYGQGYPSPFNAQWRVAGFVLRSQHILILVLAPALTLGLVTFLKQTRFGASIRAVGANPDEARACGINVGKVNATVWGIAGALGAVTAILQAPNQGSLNLPAFAPNLLLHALAVAAVGGFTSFPQAMLGGIGLGVLEQLLFFYTSDGRITALVVFLAVVAILVLRRGALNAGVRAEQPAAQDIAPLRIPTRLRQHRIIRHHRLVLTGVALTLGLVVPLLPTFHAPAQRFLLALLAVYALLAMSLTVLVGWSGQVSLGHFALLGVGAYTTARLEPHGWSLPLLLVISGAIGAVIMIVVGLPAIRLKGPALVVTTLGFGVLAPEWLFTQRWLGSGANLNVRPPGVAGVGRPHSALGVYVVTIVLFALTASALHAWRRSHPGRLLVAVRDNEAAAAALGCPVLRSRFTILALSGFVAAAAGVLWVSVWGAVSPGLLTPDNSLTLLAVPVIGGIGSLAGSVLGAVVVYGPAFFLGSLFHLFGGGIAPSLLISGVGLILTQLSYPAGLAGLARSSTERILAGFDHRFAIKEAAMDAAPVVLRVQDVSVRHRGIPVLDLALLEVRAGEIVGLIGGNGAGKTTLLDVITGLRPSETGRVTLNGTDLSVLDSSARARAGLGRGFQDGRLFPGLTTQEAIRLALARARPTGTLAALFRAPWARRAERDGISRADALLDRFGLRPWADTLIADLSTGTRRIADLVVQTAPAPTVLLLDEPTAGIAAREAEALAPILRQIRDELQCSLLVVEHDLAFLASIADRIYILEAGQVVDEVGPAELLRRAKSARTATLRSRSKRSAAVSAARSSRETA